MDFKEIVTKANEIPGIWYLATVYSAYPAGIHSAYARAVQYTAALTFEAVRVFSPIVHNHPFSLVACKTYPHAFWMEIDRPFMDMACGIIVCSMDNWRNSKGIVQEIEFFRGEGKPILYWSVEDEDRLPGVAY